MSDPIQLKLTKAGIASVLDAEMRGIKLSLDHVAYSSSNFSSVTLDDRTALDNIVYESSIAVGGVSEDKKTLRFFSVINTPNELQIKSLGIFTDEGVLFAVASVPDGNLFKVYSGISFSASFGMAISATIADMVQIKIDQNAAMALILLNNHERAENPHPQYKIAIKDIQEQFDLQVDFIDQLTERLRQLELESRNHIAANKFNLLVKEFTAANTPYPLFYKANGRTSGMAINYDLHKVSAEFLPNGSIIQTIDFTSYAVDADHYIYLPVALRDVEILSISGSPFNDVQINDIGFRLRSIYQEVVNGKQQTVIKCMADVTSSTSTYAGRNRFYVTIKGVRAYEQPLTFNNYPISNLLAVDYTVPGTYQIQIGPRQTKRFTLVGAGGGGGLAVRQENINNAANGNAGQATKLLLNGVEIAVAPAGLGGELGWWDNGSAWHGGLGGAGGVNIVTAAAIDKITALPGNAAYAAKWNHVGALSVSPIGAYGAGGAGSNGLGNNDDGWAGGGGSGAYLLCDYTNESTNEIYLTLVVGAAGEGGNYGGRKSTSGIHGFARIE